MEEMNVKKEEKKSGISINHVLLALLIVSILAAVAIPHFFPKPGPMTAMTTTVAK